MQPDVKLLYFEYTIKGLIKWFVELGEPENENNFSVLKSLKLLFFVSAATADQNHKSILLEDVFDDYYAMPYGHVESSIYREIKSREGVLNFYAINNSCSIQKPDADISVFDSLEKSILDEIDHALKVLKEQNRNLVKLSPFDLVNLSHAWYSWQKHYKIAKDLGTLSYRIPFDIIKSEDKLFKLYPF